MKVSISKAGKSVLPLALCLSFLAPACSLRSKSKAARTPPPPPPAAEPRAPETPEAPLSIAQTEVRLPEPQPVSPEALASIPAPPEAPAEQEPEEPAKPPRRAPTLPARKPEAGVTAEAPPAPPVEEARPRIQPIVPSNQVRQLQEDIENRKRTIRELVGRLSPNPTPAEKAVLERLQSFLLLSDQAAKRGDMSQAAALSERALVLARELQNVK